MIGMTSVLRSTGSDSHKNELGYSYMAKKKYVKCLVVYVNDV